MTIPAETQQLLDQLRQEDAQSHAKAMHKVISVQASARKELTTVRTLRAGYLQEWAKYIESVTDLLQKQITEQQATLTELDVREQSAMDAWAKTKADLSRLAAESPADKDDSEIEAAEIMVDEAIELEAQRQEAREQEQANTTRLLGALQDLKTQAVQQARAARDGSRTPRRRQKEADVDLTGEDTKQPVLELKPSEKTGSGNGGKPPSKQPPG